MDLANRLLKQTYHKRTAVYYEISLNRSLQSLRSALTKAKKFTLDESMSEFCAVLSSVPFKVAQERQRDVLHSLRHSAIPPFSKMFVQLDNHAFRRGLLSSGLSSANNDDPLVWDGKARIDHEDALYKDQTTHDAYGNELIPPGNDIVKDIGWLIEHDGQDVVISEFFGMNNKGDEGVLALPYRIIYSTQDHYFTDGEYLDAYTDGRFKGGWLDTKAGIIAHGLGHIYSPSFGVIYSKSLAEQEKTQNLLDVASPEGTWQVHPLVVEFGGVLRYVMAFLATLNNVPKIETEVRPQKGYLGGGQIRKYMDYTTLTLKLPQRTTKLNLAKRLIAAARKGWHEVRPHWRILKEGACKHDEHLWSERDSSGHAHCIACVAKRVWIVLPHGRGDPTISVRTHKYRVTHGVD